MKKRCLAMLCILALLLTALAGCGGSSNSNDSKKSTDAGSKDSEKTEQTTGDNEDIFDMTMVLFTFGTTPADMDKVVDAINAISIPKVGVRVKLLPISVGDMDTQMNLMLSGNEKLDLIPVFVQNFANYVAKGQVLPIDEALENYGQGIIDAIGEDYLKAGQIGGEQYGVTTCRDLAKDFGIMMRADLAEKYGVTGDTIGSLEEFESVLAAVKEGEEGIIPLIPPVEKSAWFDMVGGFDRLGDGLGVLMDSGQTLDVTNLYASQEYEDFVRLMHDWYQKGYILEDSSTASEIGPALVKAGRGFAYICGGKPGYEAQEEVMTGYDMKYITFRDAETSTSIVQTLQWAIPRNCENIDKTMQFLNLMYTDADVVNLLAWGIEGTHYVVSEDGHATYPEGVDAMNTGYGLGMGWMMGNQFLSYVWEGDELTLWDEMDTFNKSAVVSKAMGFSFDASGVKTEIAACTNVTQQYRVSLECGMVDPDVVLPEFIKALEEAGIQKIIDAKQEQLDAWAAAQ